MDSQSLDQPDAKSLRPQEDQRSQTETKWLAQVVPWQMIISCLLAAAALAWAIWLRVLFFRSFPDPFPHQDTWGYLTGAFGLLQKGHFDLVAQRTPVFPLIVWITLAVFKSFAALTVVHAALTMVSAAAVAYVVRAFGGPWQWPAALAFSFLVIHPHLLFWEHFILTEASFQALFTLAICAIALAVLRPTLARAGIAGAVTAIAVLVRPQGMFLTPLMLLALAWVGRPLGRRKLLLILAVAGAGPLLLLGGWSARNRVVHGFFGLSSAGPIQLFSVSARWIDLDRPTLAEDKALIADSIRQYQSMPEDLGWVQYAPGSPGYLIDRKYAADLNRRNEVYSALARETIFHHPMPFISRGLGTTYKTATADWGRILNLEIVDTASWDQTWAELARDFPVNDYRTGVAGPRFSSMSRPSIYEENIQPVLRWETKFIRGSLIVALLALLSLPLLRGPRRLVVAIGAISVILLMLTAGFLSDVNDRYLSGIHGSAVLAGALALTAVLERSLPSVNRLRTSFFPRGSHRSSQRSPA